ncbi:phage tail-collar fiber domain-containing protein [Aeromonas media]|uniref:phage tail-collar fiber domain-containing protein n=1 Tax=Aeromonas media TaxID=651 RepID=UPI0038D09CE8
MSQVITNAFEYYWQSSLAAEQPVVLDEFILADIPNLDITSPIDPDTGLPPESQIVHRQNVDQRGRINKNAVAYTIVMDTTVGDFSFNAMYLRNKQNGVIGMIVYKGRETKLKTDQTTGQTGNSLVKSMLMGYDQAAEATLTHVDAGTWQIDYAARLRGQDEDLRQLASQLYGHHTFIGDGFKVVQQDGAHHVTPGVAIVGGLRIELKQPQVIYPGTKPIGVWVDVHRSGSLLSEHQNHFTIITSVADLTDHVDESGYPHYVAKLATVQADSTVIDGRGQGGSGGSGAIPDTFALWKRSMAEAGYDLIGQFGSEQTIEETNQVLLSKDGTRVYAWTGGLPKTVQADSNPITSGGIGQGGWIDKSDEALRHQLSLPSGASKLGVGSGRTQEDKNNDTISVKDRGAIGNSTGKDGHDDTVAFLLAAADAKASGRPIVIESPMPGKRYRLTGTVDFRGLVVNGGQSSIWVDHDGIGVVLGGRADKGSNPDQNINTVERAPERSAANPTIRVTGSKGQRIYVKYTNWLQIWAEKILPEAQSADDPDRSSAYSSFYINWANKLTLDAPASSGGWINENDIYLNRCYEFKIQGSPSFRHNHNRIWGGTFEGESSITINRGADNKLYNMRFERGPTTISFGELSERNVIINTWGGSEFGGWPDNPLVNGTITDNGGPGNIVIDENQMYRDGIVVASADINDVVLNFTLASSGTSKEGANKSLI